MAVREIQLFQPPPDDDGAAAAAASSPELRQLLARLLARDRDDEVIRHPLQGVAQLTDTAMKGLAYQQEKARQEGLWREAAGLIFPDDAPQPSVVGPTGPTPPQSALQEPPAPPPPMPPSVDEQPIPPNDFGNEPLPPMPQPAPPPPAPMPDGFGDGIPNKPIIDLTGPSAMPAPPAAAPVPGPSGMSMPMGGGAPMPAPPPIDMSPSPPPQVNTQAADRVPQFAPPMPMGGPQVSMPDWARQGPQGGRAQIAEALSQQPAPMLPPVQSGPSTMDGFDSPMPARMPDAMSAAPPPEMLAAAGPPSAMPPSPGPASLPAAAGMPEIGPAREQVAEALSLAGPQQMASLGPMEMIEAREPGSIVGPDLQMPTSAPQIPREAVAAALDGPLPDFRGRGGPASIRYNNPGAQYPGPSARRFGSIGTETIGGGHKIAVFPDAVSGAAAQFDLFANRYTGIPLRSAIRKWSGGNSPGTYLKVIERETGLKPNTVLTREHLQDPKIAIPLAKAMSVQEAGRPYPMPDAAWQAAHAKAFGGQVASAPSSEQERISYDLPQAPTETRVAGDYTPEKLRRMYMNPHTRGLAVEIFKQQHRAAKPETTDDIREYNLARQQGYQGSFVDYMTTMKRSGATTITNDMRGERAEQIDIGKGAAGRANATMDRASAASDKLFQLSTLMEMQKRLPTDAMAQAKLTAGQWAKALGISESTLEGMGIGKDFIGDAQAFNSITSRMMVDMIGKGGFPANNFSNADREFLIQTLPRLTNDPRGNRIIMEASRRAAERDIEKARAWQSYRKANPSNSYDDFELDFRDSVQRADIFGDMKREADDLLRATNAPPSGGGPPPGAVNFLKSNPTPEMMRFFDQKYGAGASQRVLGR